VRTTQASVSSIHGAATGGLGVEFPHPVTSHVTANMRIIDRTLPGPRGRRRAEVRSLVGQSGGSLPRFANQTATISMRFRSGWKR
jgi:hypothetical protein